MISSAMSARTWPSRLCRISRTWPQGASPRSRGEDLPGLFESQPGGLGVAHEVEPFDDLRAVVAVAAGGASWFRELARLLVEADRLGRQAAASGQLSDLHDNPSLTFQRTAEPEPMPCNNSCARGLGHLATRQGADNVCHGLARREPFTVEGPNTKG